jgi:hypothetical protein
MGSKRQTTFAKLNRERAVKERRERKLEKREAAKRAREEAAAAGDGTQADEVATPSDPAPELGA